MNRSRSHLVVATGLIVLLIVGIVTTLPSPIQPTLAQEDTITTPLLSAEQPGPTVTVDPEGTAEPQATETPVPLDFGDDPSPTPLPPDPLAPSPTPLPLASNDHPPSSLYLPHLQDGGVAAPAELHGTVVPTVEPSPEPEPEDDPTLSVVGGTVANPGEWPWQARLDIYRGLPNNPDLCGGILIDPYWVLTAAHCVTADQSTTPLAINAVTVVLGDHDRTQTESGEQRPGVAQIIVHPDYYIHYSNGILEAIGHDIALLRLRQPAHLSTTVAPIPLITSPDHDSAVAPGTQAVVTGWGMTSATSNVSNKLLKASVQIGACSPGDSYLCAGNNNPSRTTCYGDSGGPLVVRDGTGQWRLAGVTSLTLNNCASTGAYTRVPHYAAWIDAQIHVRGGFLLKPSHSGKCLEVAGGPTALADTANVQQFHCVGTTQFNQIWRLIPNGDGFQVVAGHSGKCLEVAGGAMGDTANVQQWNCNGTAAQRWRLVADGSGFRLVASHSGKCLDVAGGSTTDGANVQQWSCNGTAAQRWNLAPLGMFRLVAVHSGKCLEVSGGPGALANGTNVQQWDCVPFGAFSNQLWSLIPDGNGFQLMAVHSGRCLDVSVMSSTDGINVHQWECVGQTNQRWRLVPSGNAFQLKVAHSDKCLDVAGVSTANGANVHQWGCYSGDNQRWQLIPEGQYQLVAAHSQKCLEVAGGTGALANGANVQQWDCVGPVQINQLWRPVRVGNTGSYQLVAVHSGKCLDVAGGTGALASETNIHQWSCVGPAQTNQLWKLQPDGAGYRLVAQHSLKCAEVAAGGTSNGTNVQQWECNGTAAQRWLLR